MKRQSALALMILSCLPATAQQPPAQKPSIELELLEMEQDVDKTILREALVLQGRQSMKGAPDSRPEKKQSAEDAAALRDFIAKKKDAIIARSAELAKGRVPPKPAAPVTRPEEPTKADIQAAIEKIENSKIEIWLLQTELSLVKNGLSEAIDVLASAKITPSNDETQRAETDAAQKEYDRIKAMHVELSKRLKLEQHELQSMPEMFGVGGGFQ